MQNSSVSLFDSQQRIPSFLPNQANSIRPLAVLQVVKLLIGVATKIVGGSELKVNPEQLRQSGAKMAACIDEMIFMGCLISVDEDAVLRQSKLRQK